MATGKRMPGGWLSMEVVGMELNTGCVSKAKEKGKIFIGFLDFKVKKGAIKGEQLKIHIKYLF